jgi:SPP1 gp7 family putative phage head morphogenesis protein
MARRLDPISQRLAAKSHQLQISRVSTADAIGFLIEREMREQVERVTQLVERAAKLQGPWTQKRIVWLRESIDEGFALMMDEAQDSYDKALRDFCVESYDWARKLLLRTLPRWYFRRLAPLALAGEATIEPPNPLTPTKIIIPKKVYEKFVAPALEVQSYVEPVVDADPMSQEEFEAFANEVIFPPLTRSQIETIVENGQWLRTFPGNKSKFNDPAFRDRLVEGIASGENVDQLTRRIQDLEAGVYWKARRTARTESLRVAEAAQRETWDDLGGMMAGVQILAVLDQNTRPEHADRNGQIYADEPRAGELPMDELPFVPDAPNCALPGQSVIGKVQGASKSFYTGKAVEIRVASGASIRVTPNHPVLTEDGFVSACKVSKGANLLRNALDIEGPLVSSDDEKQSPSLIEDVFRSLSELFGQFPTKSKGLDFHGDAAGFDGDIQVVAVQGELLLAGEAHLFESGDYSQLVRADVGLAGESGFGASEATGAAGDGIKRLSAAGFPGTAELTGNQGGVALDPLPLNSLLVGLRAKDRPVFEQMLGQSERVPEFVVETASRDTEFFRQLIDRFPGVVSSDEVLDVREFEYSGHVYDLQTESGWYFLDGIIVHNCRCFTVPVLVPPDDVGDDPAFTAIFQNTDGANIPDPAAYDKWFDQADDGQRKLAAGTRRYNDMAERLGGVRNPEWTDFVDPETGSLLSRNQLSRETDAERDDRRRANEELFRRREDMLKTVAARGYLSR